MRIQKAIGSETHPCKCVVGIYQTYSGDVVRFVDAAGEGCRRHTLGQQLQSAGDNRQMPSGPALARRSS